MAIFRFLLGTSTAALILAPVLNFRLIIPIFTFPVLNKAHAMLNIISLIWGSITLLVAVLFLFPFLGWGNWLVIPMAVIGIIIGAFSDKRGGLYLNLAALLLALFRLSIGGGLF